MIYRNSWRNPQGELQHSRIWSYEFTLGGIRHRGSTKTENKALAKRIEAERRREHELGIARLPGPEKPLTFENAAEVHLATNPAWSARNLSIETYNVGKLLPVFGKKLLTEITADDISKFQAMCKKADLGPRTTNMICGTLRQVLPKYRLWSNLEQDYKPMVVRKDIGKALSPDEQHRLLAACQKSRSRSLYPAWLLTTHTGLRHNETAHLTWAQVDLIDGWIQVGRSKTAAGTGRRVPITATLLAVLKEWRGQFPNCQPGHYVFPSEAYSAIGLAPGAVHHVDPTKPILSWKTAWTTARKLAGVNCRWHDGRHCYISALAGSGVPDAVIMALAGHVEVEVMRLYSHTGNAAKRAAIAVFDAPANLENPKFHPKSENAPSATVQ